MDLFSKILFSSYGAIQTGMIWGIVALGIFLTYRILDYADLTVDGTVTLGGAIAAIMISKGLNPWLTLPVAFAGGAIMGMVTALLHTKLRIPALLSGILTQIGLKSINIFIMGGGSLQGSANVSTLNIPNIFSATSEAFQKLAGDDPVKQAFFARFDSSFFQIVICVGVIAVLVALLWYFLNTEKGLALRATGINQRMIRAMGVNTDNMIIIGLMLSNAIVALAGAMYAQSLQNAEANMGMGTIVFGLAAIIIGEQAFKEKKLLTRMICVVLGSCVYRLIVAYVYQIGVPTIFFSAVTSIVVICFLAWPMIQKNRSRLK